MSYKCIQHPLGFFQVDPLPTQRDLEMFYKENYYQQLPADTYCANYSLEEKKYFHNKAIVADHIWTKFSDRKTGSLIDIGCGEGFFASYFKQSGWDVQACDFSSYGVQQQNPCLLPYFEQGDIYEVLENKIKASKKYDFINLANVLEHVLDPLELLERLKKIMHIKTILRISVPNDFSAFQNMLIEKKCITEPTWFHPPDHLNYFTHTSLENTLIEGGFFINRMIADFPIEIYLLNEHSNYWKDRNKGSESHLCRLQIENFLVAQGVDNYINYMVAASKCGIGRSVIAFASIKQF